MKEYRINKYTAEVTAFRNHKPAIRKMDDLENAAIENDTAPQAVKTFSGKAEALEALNGYVSSARMVHNAVSFYAVELYAVAEYDVETDEDGDVEDETFMGIWKVAPWMNDLFADAEEEA